MSWAWSQADCGAHVAWASWLDSRRRIDPYLVWADLTRFAALGGVDNEPGHPSGGRLPLLVEAESDPIFEGEGKPCCFAAMDIPGVYLVGDPTKPSPRRFFTARVAPQCLQLLLESCEAVRRFQLGLPRVSDTARNAVPLDVEALDIRPPVVIGVIDDGCPFAHPQFAAHAGSPPSIPAGRTRVVALWDQGRRTVPVPGGQAGHWSGVSSIGYGAELTPETLQRLTAPSKDAPAAEDRFYREAGYGRVHWSRSLHGTGVLDLVAGATAPLPARDERSPHQHPPAKAERDQAGKAPIVFVQLPARAVLDTSGGSLGVHLLDGLKYLVDRADRIKARPAGGALMARQAMDAAAPAVPAQQSNKPPRIVATVSFGSIAGPHDGTSMIEMAVAELVREEKRLAVVVAAGNAHGSRTHAGLGAKAPGQTTTRRDATRPPARAWAELPAGASHEVTWNVAPDNPFESYLEIWLPPLSESFTSVSVQPPGALSPVQVHAGSAQVLCDAQGADDVARAPVAGIVFARRVAQGLRGTMVLVAVGATRPYDPLDQMLEQPGEDGSTPALPTRSPPRPTAPAGPWRVSVTNKGLTGIEVHLWAERNDIVGRRQRVQQATLSDDAGGSILSESSLSSLANGTPDPARGETAAPVFVVGGYRLSDGKMAPYSGGGPGVGPSPRAGPDVEAPSDLSLSMPGLRVAGTMAGSTARLGGTSAAAPQLARLLVNAKWSTWQEAAALLDRDQQLDGVVADPIEDSPPWPDPMPYGRDDAVRRGRRRL